MKKKEWIIILIIVAVCIAVLLFRFVTQDDGARVVVTYYGEEYGTYSLNKDQVIEIGGTNVLTIEDGKAWMSEADCPDQLCTYMGQISQTGEMIVCLPNRVVAEVTDAD